MVVIPYVSGVSEKLGSIFKKRRISTAMKPHNTFKGLLLHAKDKTGPKEGVYRIHCVCGEGGYEKCMWGDKKNTKEERRETS